MQILCHLKYLFHHGQKKVLSIQITFQGYFTYSSKSPQWSCCCCLRRQGLWSGPRRPPPLLRDNTSLGWKERCLIWTLQKHLESIIVRCICIEKTFDFTLRCGSPPSCPGLSSTICMLSWCSTHRTPQGYRWSQRGSDDISLWQQLQWDEEQDESLPGEGKGGIVQFAFAGKTSTSVSVPHPPVIIKPAQ